MSEDNKTTQEQTENEKKGEGVHVSTGDEKKTDQSGIQAVSNGVAVPTASDPYAISGTPTTDVKSPAHTPTPESSSSNIPATTVQPGIVEKDQAQYETRPVDQATKDVAMGRVDKAPKGHAHKK